MGFNSIEFATFLPIVFLLYWWAHSRSLRLQNAILLAASYVFYGWWDWRFLGLIVLSSTVDFLVGIGMARTPTRNSKTTTWCWQSPWTGRAWAN